MGGIMWPWIFFLRVVFPAIYPSLSPCLDIISFHISSRSSFFSLRLLGPLYGTVVSFSCGYRRKRCEERDL